MHYLIWWTVVHITRCMKVSLVIKQLLFKGAFLLILQSDLPDVWKYNSQDFQPAWSKNWKYCLSICSKNIPHCCCTTPLPMFTMGSKIN